MIIVEDPAGTLPPAIEALEEMIMFLHHFNMPGDQHGTGSILIALD